jgi:arylsulfatase A-like enzyme
MLVSDDPHGTTHGTPYKFDTHVPLIFWGQGVTGHRVLADSVRTVDIAPTMAALLGLPTMTGVDGVVIDSVLAPTH